ncbi:MAG: HAMP domain-containing protein [Gemmatimonadales bacterium]|nr:MAG: HAMP domain-containing protein [Gemmatimonadales bacterium]
MIPLPPAAPLLLGGASFVALWVGTGNAWLLVAAATCLLGSAVLRRPDEVPVQRWTLLALGLAVIAGGAAEFHTTRISATWDDRARLREAQVRDQLSQDLDALLLAGEGAVARLLALYDPGLRAPRAVLSQDLLTDGVDAVAIFGPGGELLAWEGGHQGPVPRNARLGLSPYIYAESALFGYLYVTRPLPEGTGTAVAVSLLRADLPATLEDASADFVSRFLARSGARIQVGREDRVEGEVAWGLTWEREVLFSVAVVPASEAEVRSRVELRWSWLVALLLAAVWIGVARGMRGARGGRILSGAGLVLILLGLPLGRLSGNTRLFSPADLYVPLPLTLTLGDLLVLAAAGVLLLGFASPFRLPRPPRIPAALAAVGGILLAALLLGLFRQGASRDLLSGPELLWSLYHGAAFLSVSLVVALAIQAGRGAHGNTRVRWVVAASVLACVLGVVAAWLVRTEAAFPVWMILPWFLPLLALIRAFGVEESWGGSMLRWVGVGVVSATLVLPWAWGSRVEARIAGAEDRIERLGTRPDPFLEFLLLRTGEEARALSLSGRNPVEVLYGAWAGSGLAREGVPVWLTWWSPDGFAQEELRIGVATPRPQIPADLRMAALMEGDVRLVRSDQAETHYVVAAPLAQGATLTAVVPPRRGFAGDSPLGPLFSPARFDPDPVSLIPLLPEEALVPTAPGVAGTPTTEAIRWTLTPEGWRGETALAFPDQIYLAQYHVALPRPLLVLARGTLLLIGSVGLLLLLWTGGRRLAAPTRLPWKRGAASMTSFRGRVTLALFGFFLLPTILFGMLAYRTLSSASVRTAETLAARAAEDAAAGFADTGGAMDLLAARVGSDLLLYEGGQLVGGSQRELVELGLYQGWLPPAVHRTMTGGSELLTTTIATLGGWDYVVAYRRIPGGRVLAAPAALQAGATAVRQREVADLLAFTLVLGAGLSVLLALLVGRALARPIQTLQVASERVGSGNMGVHLPSDRTDEFGAVFEAFNRMVDRLARTRRALVRSSRRTRAIVEEVATGVIALDPQGRVTLANPRAEALLGSRLPRSQSIREVGAEGTGRREVGRWVTEYLRDGVAEASAEFTLEGRRIRFRVRRISGGGSPSGAVIALEDVTDELRTERILAWGEMAQQVAHEVKNPLTPIKLGIQHIRRAWVDRSPDYDAILDRNVTAILGEIDRLAAISTSFSRFGAPGPVAQGPLDVVDVNEVVAEVMVLYAAGNGVLRFEASLDPDLPAVWSRSDELKEVLVNLLENARAALPEGGRVEVLGGVEGDGVCIRVVDDGVGIPEDLVARVFEPHFSTRSSGSGLGLAIVRRLVESWGGRVHADSEEGKGTTIQLFLRRSDDADAADPRAEEPGETPTSAWEVSGGGAGSGPSS